jgi:hypothetical protein
MKKVTEKHPFTLSRSQVKIPPLSCKILNL